MLAPSRSVRGGYIPAGKHIWVAKRCKYLDMANGAEVDSPTTAMQPVTEEQSNALE